MLTDPEASAQSPQHWSWKKITLWFLGILVVFIVAVLAYDEKLEPFEDLVPVRTSVPDAQTNGYLFLKTNWETLPALTAEGSNYIQQVKSGLIAWDSAKVKSLNPSGADLRGKLREALALPDWQALPLEVSYDAFYGGSWAGNPLLALEAEAILETQNGNPVAVLDLVADLRRFSARQLDGSFNVADLATGIRSDKRALNITCGLISAHPKDAAALDRALAIWSQETFTTEDLEKPIRAESAYFRNGFNPDARDRDDARLLGVMDTFWKRLLVKRNQSWNYYHRAMRDTAKGWLAPAAEKAASSDGKMEAYWKVQNTSQIGFWLNPNLLGNGLTRNQLGFAGIFLGKECRMHLFHGRAMQVWLAIKKWQLANPDRVPETLQELVPDYLPAIPLDPWNGKAMGWDAKTRFIFAVGSDWSYAAVVTTKSQKEWTTGEGSSPGLRLELPPTTLAPLRPSLSPQTPMLKKAPSSPPGYN